MRLSTAVIFSVLAVANAAPVWVFLFKANKYHYADYRTVM